MAEPAHQIDEGIDFIMPWLDDSDPAWRAQKARYDGSTVESVRDERFREWGLLRYWFRGVERFAPWVRKVHIVTWGHVPDWLNLDHPKLSIVRHEDYIPAQWLPTFSVYPIELNFHRIADLSERFVYFCDDMYLLRDVKPDDFFKGDLPCGTASLVPARMVKGDWFAAPLNDVAVINAHFDYRKSTLGHLGKWINPKYGTLSLSSLLMLPFPAFYGFYEHHLPGSYLKSTYEEVWAAEEEILSQTCSHRFRDRSDVNLWLMENWQYASGAFAPRSAKFGKAFYLGSEVLRNAKAACEYISGQRGSVICVNDSPMDRETFARAREMVDAAFQSLLPEKSQFEK